MGDEKLQLAMVITGNSSGAKAAFADLAGTSSRSASKIRAETNSIKSAWSGVMGKLAAIGFTVGAAKIIHDSAVFQKQLLMIGVSAGKSSADVDSLKNRIRKLTVESGGDAGQLAAAFDLVRKRTGSWDIAEASIGAINTAMAATGSNAETLSGAMSAASKSFGIDFTKAGSALDFFNKLSAAGQGAGGLESVAGTFEHMAARAQVAGLSAQSTMQLINAMGQVQSDPEQAGMMAENVLRMFTNLRSLSNKKSGGFRNILFDPSGTKRDAVDVMKSIQAEYNKLGDESAGGSRKKQDMFLARLTGGMDTRSLMGFQALLQKADFNKAAAAGPDNLQKKMRDATNEMLANINKIKAALATSADPWLKKLTGGISNVAGYASKNMSGGEIAATGIATIIAAGVGENLLKGWAGKMLKGASGTAAGVAEGRALQMAAGVTPVFVTNWPGGGIATGIGMPAALGLPLAGGKMAGVLSFLGKAGLVGSIAMLAFEGTRTALKLTGGEEGLKKLGGALHRTFSGNKDQPVHVTVNIDKDGKALIVTNSQNAKTAINVRNRGQFYPRVE